MRKRSNKKSIAKRSANGVFINIIKTNYFGKGGYDGRIVVEGLSPSDEFVGGTIYCQCLSRNTPIEGNWAITSGYQYASINKYGRIDVEPGVSNQNITI